MNRNLNRTGKLPEQTPEGKQEMERKLSEMRATSVRDRIAEALWPWINSPDAANAIADKLLSIPGIAIMDLPETCPCPDPWCPTRGYHAEDSDG